MWFYLWNEFILVGATYFIGQILMTFLVRKMRSIFISVSESEVSDEREKLNSSDDTLDSQCKTEGESLRSDCASEDKCVSMVGSSETDMANLSKELNLDDFVFSEDDLQSIELELTSNEKISLAFMYFDDVNICLKYCRKFKDRYKYRGFIKFSRNILPKTRSTVLIECLYLLKNYFLLEKYGIDKYAAKNIFSKSSYINPERLLLYKICDSLTMNETKRVIDTIDSLSNEKYLEIFFLKLTEPEQWVKVRNVLHEIDGVEPFISDFDKLVDSKQTEKHMDVCTSPQSPVIAEVATPKYVDAYPIKDHNNVGLCLIINHLHFTVPQLPKREGSEKDVEAIQNVMKELNFEVIVVRDALRQYFAKPLLHKIHQEFKDNFSIFFLCIMSHGNEGVFYTSDSKPVSIQSDIFNILNYAPKLKGIPKVIVVQACQGNKFLKCNKIVTDSINFESDLLDITTDDNLSEIQSCVGEYISDAILVMSTVPGFKSFRQTEFGSYFIQSLCHCLQKYQHYNFVDIVTEVIKCVDSEVVLPTKIKNLNLSQQPLYTSLLKKKLYLKKLPSE